MTAATTGAISASTLVAATGSLPMPRNHRLYASAQPISDSHEIAGDVARRELARQTLDDEHHRQDHEPAGEQLPRRERQQRDGASPLLGQHDARCHRQRAAECGDDADRVERHLVAQHQQRDADDAHEPGEQVDALNRSPSNTAASAAATSGWIAPTAAATPPGRR